MSYRILLNPNEKIRAGEKRMGIWDAVSSTADSVNKRLRDPQPVKNAGWAVYSAVAGKLTVVASPIAGILRGSYDLSHSAIFTVDRAVRVEGLNRVRGSMPDKEALMMIGKEVANITIDSYSRPFTGGLPIYRTAVNVLMKTNAKGTQNIKAEELKELRYRMEQLEAKVSANRSEPPYHRIAGLQQKPEDVISIFMMKGLAAADFVNDQMVLQHHKKWRDA